MHGPCFLHWSDALYPTPRLMWSPNVLLLKCEPNAVQPSFAVSFFFFFFFLFSKAASSSNIEFLPHLKLLPILA